MDIIGISALVLSISNAVVVVLHEIHIKKCYTLCCSSDCTKSQPSTPTSIVKQPNYQGITNC